jgi:hypothetical protein
MANELDATDEQNQACDDIELGIVVRQRDKQHENTTQHGGDQADADLPRSEEVVCCCLWPTGARFWWTEQPTFVLVADCWRAALHSIQKQASAGEVP